jgi:uncharacterized integral membrane protein
MHHRAMLAQMLVEKSNRHNTLDGSTTAKFVNSVSNLLAPCHVIMKRATTQQVLYLHILIAPQRILLNWIHFIKTADVIVDLPLRVSSRGHEFVLVANRATVSFAND